MDEHLSDLSAERCVIAGLYQYGIKSWLEIGELVLPTTFTNEITQILFKILYSLIVEQKIERPDKASVLSCAASLGFTYLFQDQETLEQIRLAFNAEVRLENVILWAAKIRKLEIARLLKKQLRDANKKLDDIKGIEPIEQIVGIAEDSIFDFSQLLINSDSDKPSLMGDDLEAWITHIESNPVDILGISSGYHLYDISIGGGFRRKTVSLIGSRSGIGKSQCAINIALFVAGKLKVPTLYLDTEMNKLDHWGRTLANLCYNNGYKITINDIETGQYSRSEKKKTEVRRAADSLSKMPFYYQNVSGKSFESIISIMRRWIHQSVGTDNNGNLLPCLIIYDYVKLMTSENLSANLSEYQALGFLMTSMHNFAVKQDVPILAFVQLNRDGINNEETSVISGSDRILWLTTNFSIFKDKSPEEIAADGIEHGNKKLVVLKSRHGSGLTPGDYINYYMIGEYGKVLQGQTRFQLRQNKQGNNSGIPADAH